MKKLIAMLLVLTMALVFVACAGGDDNSSAADSSAADSSAVESSDASSEASSESSDDSSEASDDSSADVEVVPEGVMTFEEYLAAEVGTEVTVETYVQANQSWWNDSIVLYCQSTYGATFIYNLACTEEQAATLVAGTKIRVTGSKAEFDGEVEIMDATFELVEGADTYVAEPIDLTDKLGTEELINDMNKLASFKGLTFKSLEYKNGEPGDDIYVTFTKGDAEYNFCVEVYLTGPDSDVYKTVGELKEGDVVDVEGFLYWYQGANPHITKITVADAE